MLPLECVVGIRWLVFGVICLPRLARSSFSPFPFDQGWVVCHADDMPGRAHAFRYRVLIRAPFAQSSLVVQ